MNNTAINNTAFAKEKARPGYKKTKLGWIPEEWDVKELSKLGIVLSGLTYSPKDVTNDGTLVLRSSNIQENQLSFNDNVFVDTTNLKFNKVIEEDILICVRNGSKKLIGKNASITKEVEGEAFGAFMSIYRSKYNPFLKHYFKTELYQKEIHKNLGATINSINGSNLKRFKVPFPPLSEQQKIASILNTWDKAIAAQEQLIAQKQELKKGLMQALLTGKKRFNGFTEEWEEVRLKDVGKIVTGSTPKTKEADNYGGEYLFVSPADMGENKYIKTTIKTVTEKGLNSGRIIPKGSVLFVCIGSTIGKVAISNCQLITNQQINAIIPNKNHSANFIYYQLLKEGARIKLIAGEQAVPMINKSDFSTIKIMVTSLEEQEKISDTLSSKDKEIDILKEKVEHLKKQKQGLMQQLLTGEKRVKI